MYIYIYIYVAGYGMFHLMNNLHSLPHFTHLLDNISGSECLLVSVKVLGILYLPRYRRSNSKKKG